MNKEKRIILRVTIIPNHKDIIRKAYTKRHEEPCDKANALLRERVKFHLLDR